MSQLLSKEEIVKRHTDGWVGGMTPGDEERIVYPSMDEYAKQEAIEFFKWNAASVKGYVDYIMRARESESDEQLQSNLDKFETATLEERYNLYVQSKQSKTI